MSLYDILMLIIFAGAIFLGWWKGFAWQVASIISIFLSYFVALNFRGVLASKITVEEPWNDAIAMLVLFLGTGLVVWVVFGFIRKSIERMQLKSWDRQSGAVLGAIKGALLCMVITLFAVSLLGDGNKRAIINSNSGRIITSAINQLAVAVPENLRAKIDGYLNDFNQEVEKHHNPDETTAPFEPSQLANAQGWFTGNQYVGSVTTESSLSSGQPVYEGGVQVVPNRNTMDSQAGNQSIINWDGVGQRVFDAARDQFNGNRQQ